MKINQLNKKTFQVMDQQAKNYMKTLKGTKDKIPTIENKKARLLKLVIINKLLFGKRVRRN